MPTKCSSRTKAEASAKPTKGRRKRKSSCDKITGAQLLRAARVYSHRGALAEYLGSELTGRFLPSSDDGADYIIEAEDGSIQTADLDAVFGLSNELKAMAADARARARALLRQDVGTLAAKELPKLDDDESEDDPIQCHVEMNPSRWDPRRRREL